MEFVRSGGGRPDSLLLQWLLLPLLLVSFSSMETGELRSELTVLEYVKSTRAARL